LCLIFFFLSEDNEYDPIIVSSFLNMIQNWASRQTCALRQSIAKKTGRRRMRRTALCVNALCCPTTHQLTRVQLEPSVRRHGREPDSIARHCAMIRCGEGQIALARNILARCARTLRKKKRPTTNAKDSSVLSCTLMPDDPPAFTQ
jgi:hypothetical protein